MVCGAPGSGKSPYCNARASDEDDVVDLDEIKAEISGLPLHHARNHWLERALKERNERLLYLAEKMTGRVFLIVGAPKSRERQWWIDRLGCDEVVVLEVPQSECVARCKADATRLPSKNYARIIWLGWKSYTRREGDVVIEA